MKKIIIVILFCCINLLIADELQNILAKLKSNDESLKTCRGSIIQTTILGKNKKTFSGKFYFQKPDKVKIEYEKPFDQIIVSNDEKFWQYVPSQKTVRVAKWSELEISEKPQLDFGLNILGLLSEDYALELKGFAKLDGGETILINAIPNVKTEVKNISKISIWISKDFLMPLKFEIYDESDNVLGWVMYENYKDYSGVMFPQKIHMWNRLPAGHIFNHITYKNVDINKAIDKNIFNFVPPKDTKVVEIKKKGGDK
ncbi:MAG: outer-membrane lipoprotein carrier protein LolA [Elusimicrobiota bacterium]|nr:outer-membrane lipoprotein carrier protein LolA [Elusimicrobiota bacterium]